MRQFAIKGCIVCSSSPQQLQAMEEGFLLVEGSLVKGVFSSLPSGDIPVTDCTGKLVIPGMTDLHVHAPQYTYRGSGMDLELLQWLERYTFPEESRYGDMVYAKKAYARFVRDLKHTTTTRACVFATVHTAATVALMDMLEATGLVTCVGRVNMDRNSPDALREPSAAAALTETERWLQQVQGRYRRTFPILTPRFTPSCSDELMEGLGRLRKKYGVPVQSHLSENPGEIAWVQELCPDTEFYAEAYDKFGMLGGSTPCVMAHCVHSSGEEQALLKSGGVFIAHSPESNANVASGIAPVSRYLQDGLRVGLASDVAGGSQLSLLRAMVLAVQESKLRWRLCGESIPPLTFPQAFYMATVGGGQFFGQVGTFLSGWEADVVVLDDSGLGTEGLSPETRLERAVYLCDDRHITAKYVRGKKVL